MGARQMRLPTTIGAVLEHRAARNIEAPAIVCTGLETLTFGALAKYVRALGDQFRRAGIGPTSRVGVALPRGPEAALVSVAVCSTATLMPINPTLSPAELKAELARIRVDALILPGWTDVPEWAATPDAAFGIFKVSKAITSFDEIALDTDQADCAAAAAFWRCRGSVGRGDLPYLGHHGYRQACAGVP